VPAALRLAPAVPAPAEAAPAVRWVARVARSPAVPVVVLEVAVPAAVLVVPAAAPTRSAARRARPAGAAVAA
jgi:hypothetical protein